MTQQELDIIIEKHQHWLKKDCEGWEGMKANLRGANLREADLSGADLSGFHFFRTREEAENY